MYFTQYEFYICTFFYYYGVETSHTNATKNILEIHNGNNGWYSNQCFLDLLK